MVPSAIHDFADHAGGRQAGQARQVHRGFRLAGAHQHAAFARAQRKMWPGRARSAGRQSGSMAARMVRVRSAAEMPVVTPSRASMDSQNAVPKLEVFSGRSSAADAGNRSAPASAPGRSGRGRAWP